MPPTGEPTLEVLIQRLTAETTSIVVRSSSAHCTASARVANPPRL
jgi:hypothetical protein